MHCVVPRVETPVQEAAAVEQPVHPVQPRVDHHHPQHEVGGARVPRRQRTPLHRPVDEGEQRPVERQHGGVLRQDGQRDGPPRDELLRAVAVTAGLDFEAPQAAGMPRRLEEERGQPVARVREDEDEPVHGVEFQHPQYEPDGEGGGRGGGRAEQPDNPEGPPEY